jgi:Tol biopolymer transport system component
MREGSAPHSKLLVLALGLMGLVGCGGPGPRPSDAGSAAVETAPATVASNRPTLPDRATPSGTIDVSTLTGRIAFSGGPYPNLDIYAIEADGSRLRQVTSRAAAEFDPSWSPDGSRIAYRYQTTNDQSTDIYVIDADGSRARNLSGNDGKADWGPAWSPDGSLIAWNTSAEGDVGFDLGLIRPDGTGRTEARPGVFVEYPAWSPDGSQVAFMSQIPEEGSQYDIFVMDKDGSHVLRLTTDRAVDGWPSWSPDGRVIAFSSTRDDCGQSSAQGCLSTGDIGPYHMIYLMAPDGSAQRPLSRLFGQIADWSPDGRYLVFEGRTGLTVLSADGSANGTIPVAVGEPAFPDWIP